MQGRVDGKYIEHRKEARYWLSIANIHLKSWLHRLKPEKRNFLLRLSQLLRHWRGQKKLKIATDEEIKRLEAWELYSVMVNRVDTANPDWPEKPAQI